ncbi:MAG TPA: cytochrome c oxidase subunit 3 family protein [Candidatus Polarisedimenticolaceae bacterium]|nr:cytochrome c oxidase subunit 3 family protein [Candidatus Polarisedimenticolaceae bacterium]
MSDHAHSPYLQHHFETPQQQFDAGKLGIWLFLATEILLFGGLFCAYAIYRANHPEIFVYAHQFLNKYWGGTNTVILLCSSLTMAWAVRAAQLGQRRLLVVLLSLTLLGAMGFLGIKYVEYKEKWEHGLLWGARYAPHVEGHGTEEAPVTKAQPPPPAPAPPASPGGFVVERSAIRPAAAGPEGTVIAAEEQEEHLEAAGIHRRPANVQIFFSIYFLMTGLHGIHVLVGMGAILWILVRSIRGDFGPQYFTPVDFVGLYWHLVDLIWIFLFPLLYLIH